MRRLGMVGALLVATALMGGTASADIEWCAEDPVFKVLGSHFRVTTSVAASASEVEVIRYAVSLPSDAQGATKVHFPQRHKIPATVVITYDGPAAGSSATFPATVVITVIGTAGADVVAKLSGPDVQATSVAGTTGATVTLAFNVQAR